MLYRLDFWISTHALMMMYALIQYYGEEGEEVDLPAHLKGPAEVQHAEHLSTKRRGSEAPRASPTSQLQAQKMKEDALRR